MADREKVIKGFEICDNNEDGIVCKNCPYKEDKWNGAWEDETGKTCFQTLHADVLELLKEISVSPDWFCADGKKDGGQMKRPKETFWDSLSEVDLMEPMHHFED